MGNFRPAKRGIFSSGVDTASVVSASRTSEGDAEQRWSPKEFRGRQPPPSSSCPCPAWFSRLPRPFLAGAPPRPAVATNRSKDADISPVSPARAPLRRIQRMPSITRRLSIYGRPPCRGWGNFGSKGPIFFHCPSVSNGPARTIGAPLALLPLLIPGFARDNHQVLNGLCWVVQPALVSTALERVLTLSLVCWHPSRCHP
jgi:hypothetical protein